MNVRTIYDVYYSKESENNQLCNILSINEGEYNVFNLLSASLHDILKGRRYLLPQFHTNRRCILLPS